MPMKLGGGGEVGREDHPAAEPAAWRVWLPAARDVVPLLQESVRRAEEASARQRAQASGPSFVEMQDREFAEQAATPQLSSKRSCECVPAAALCYVQGPAVCVCMGLQLPALSPWHCKGMRYWSGSRDVLVRAACLGLHVSSWAGRWRYRGTFLRPTSSNIGEQMHSIATCARSTPAAVGRATPGTEPSGSHLARESPDHRCECGEGRRGGGVGVGQLNVSDGLMCTANEQTVAWWEQKAAWWEGLVQPLP